MPGKSQLRLSSATPHNPPPIHSQNLRRETQAGKCFIAVQVRAQCTDIGHCRVSPVGVRFLKSSGKREIPLPAEFLRLALSQPLERMIPMPATEKPTLVSSKASEKVGEQISRRAHELYEARGREDGHDLEDWL